MMDIGDQFSLEHLLFKDRKCKTFNKVNNLIEDFYMSRKQKRGLPSAYSYECKDCTIKRIVAKRKSKKKNRPRPLPPYLADYPDW
jgi:hypothetical protein